MKYIQPYLYAICCRMERNLENRCSQCKSDRNDPDVIHVSKVIKGYKKKFEPNYFVA